MSILNKYKNLLNVDDRASQGEVGTPVELVNEMLDKLPVEVFKSNSTTFLDPGFGNGTFLIEIVKRLRKEGHSIENIQERVYGCEISHRLFNKVSKLFSNYNFHKLYKEDFLTKDFNNMKFDVVIGNPPYQDSDNVGRRKDKAKNLWSKFIQKGYGLLKDEGHLGIICPNAWLSPSADIGKGKKGLRFLRDYFSEGSLYHVNVKDVNKHFPTVAVEISYFLYSRKPLNIAPTLVTLDHRKNIIEKEITLKDYKFLPRDLNPLALSITNKLLDNSREKFNFTTTNSKHGVKNWSIDETLPYKVYHSASKKGIKYYSEDIQGLKERKKVIVSASSVYAPYYDKGEYLYSNMTMAYLLEGEEQLKNVKSILSSKLYLLVNEFNIWGGWVSFETIRNLPKLDTSKEWTNEEIYREFGLSREEIEFIESYEYVENKHPKLI